MWPYPDRWLDEHTCHYFRRWVVVRSISWGNFSERGLVLLTGRLTTLCCQLSLNTQLISWGGVEDSLQSWSKDIGVPFEQGRNQYTPCGLFFLLKVGFSVCLVCLFLNQHPLLKEFLSFSVNKNDLSFWKACFVFEVYVSDINTSFHPSSKNLVWYIKSENLIRELTNLLSCSWGRQFLSVSWNSIYIPALKNYFVSVCLHEYFIINNSIYFHWATSLLEKTCFTCTKYEYTFSRSHLRTAS